MDIYKGDIKLINTESRIFESWGSLDIVDRQGDRIPIEEFSKILPSMMLLKPQIHLEHSNKPVAEILDMMIKTNEKGHKGIYIVSKMFNKYEFHNQVWKDLQDKIYTGLSFGGMAKDNEYSTDSNGHIDARILKDIEGVEFSLVKRPANQEALVTAISVAKSDAKEIKKEGEKDMEGKIKLEDIMKSLETIGKRLDVLEQKKEDVKPKEPDKEPDKEPEKKEDVKPKEPEDKPKEPDKKAEEDKPKEPEDDEETKNLEKELKKLQLNKEISELKKAKPEVTNIKKDSKTVGGKRPEGAVTIKDGVSIKDMTFIDIAKCYVDERR